MSSGNADIWKLAIGKEESSITQRKTCDLVKRRPDMNFLPCMYIFILKDSVAKARIVAKGCRPVAWDGLCGNTCPCPRHFISNLLRNPLWSRECRTFHRRRGDDLYVWWLMMRVEPRIVRTARDFKLIDQKVVDFVGFKERVTHSFLESDDLGWTRTSEYSEWCARYPNPFVSYVI